MSRMDAFPLRQPGTFTLGCNYWASHAGTRMWTDWREDVVDADLARLAAAGLQTLRVFPLWSDFQPLTAVRGGHGTLREMRFGEEPLPDDELGHAGVSGLMIERFAIFCALARRHRLGLIVGLITGWMSGRLYMPEALAGRNPITDPLALQWQARFVRAFVTRFRDDAAVWAWDLGNECNCMGAAGSREATWTWTALITGAIRGADPERAIVSGMHSLLPSGEQSGGWTISDQAELTDVLTTHPYPLWSRHTNQDPLDSIRTTLHATAESRMYADIGGKPCFAEEIGTMGPMMGDWDAAANFVRTNLFSLWANDCRGFLWWCAFDQTRLPHAPYDWIAVERELGLLREDGSSKPMLDELSAFARLLRSLPFATLPERRIDAVCVLTRGQDAWGVAYAAWVLATQAKLSLRFAWGDDPLPDARLYLLPGLAGIEPISRRRWLDLLARVEAGAELYASLGDGVLAPFTKVFGVRVRARATRTGPTPVRIGDTTITARHGLDLRLSAEPGTEVLGSAPDGAPMLTRRAYGQGRVVLAAWPLEAQLTATPGGFHREGAEACHVVYRLLGTGIARAIDCDDPAVAVTVHDGRWAVLVNHGEQAATPRLAQGVRIARWLHGGPTVAAHDGAIVELAKD